MLLPPRSSQDRLVAGVCAGLASAVRADVSLVRLAFLLLSLAWGAGAVLYVVGWLLMPDETAQPSEDLRRVMRSNVNMARRDLNRSATLLSRAWHRTQADIPWPRPLSRRWIAIGFLGLGAVLLIASWGGFAWITPMRAAALASIALGAAVWGTLS